MKCDNCKFMYCGFGIPSPEVACTKDHWDGLDFLDEEDVDPWIDCLDFQENAKNKEKPKL